MTTVERVARPARTDSMFFSSMAIAMALVVFAGFSRTFYMRAVFAPPPLANPGLMIAHGLAFTAWIAVLVTQVSLVAAGRRAAHMTLGIFGTGLAGAMAVLGIMLAIDALRRSHAHAGAHSPEAFFAIPITLVTVFLILTSLGIANRARPDWHKRFMILATMAILPAAVARIPAGFIAHGGPPVFYGLTDLFLVAMAIYDVRSKGRVHPATLWAGAIAIGAEVASLALGMSAPWLAFATWLAK